MAKRQKNAGEKLNDLAKSFGAEYAYRWDNGNWSFWLPGDVARVDLILRKDGLGYSLRLSAGPVLHGKIKQCGFEIIDLRDRNTRDKVNGTLEKRLAEEKEYWTQYFAGSSDEQKRLKRNEAARKRRAAKKAEKLAKQTQIGSATLLRLVGPIYGEG